MARTGEANGAWAATADELKQAALMPITLPSGKRVVVKAVTLDELVALDALPDDLIGAAVLAMSPGSLVLKMAAHQEQGDAEAVRKLSRDNLQLRDRVVQAALVDPEVTLDDVAGMDPFDKEMIAAFAQRRLVEDAEGKRVGADSLDSFRRGCEQLASGETDEARRAVLLELAQVQ